MVKTVTVEHIYSSFCPTTKEKREYYASSKSKPMWARSFSHKQLALALSKLSFYI